MESVEPPVFSKRRIEREKAFLRKKQRAAVHESLHDNYNLPTRHKISRWMTAILILSCIAAQVLYACFTEVAKSNGKFLFSSVEVVLLSELLKLVVAALGVGSLRYRTARSTWTHISWQESIGYAVPAFGYVVTNNLTLLAYEWVENPITAQVFSVLQIVAVGITSRCLLKRRLSWVQWIAILLLVSAVLRSRLASCKDCIGLQDYDPIVAAITIAAGLVAALSSVENERLLKSQRQVSLMQQNLHVYAWGLFFNACVLIAAEDDTIEEDVKMSKFNFPAVLLVVTTAYLGLVHSAIIKHQSNVIKVFVTSASLSVSTIIFMDGLNSAYVLASADICLAVFLYQLAPKSLPSIVGTFTDLSGSVSMKGISRISGVGVQSNDQMDESKSLLSS